MLVGRVELQSARVLDLFAGSGALGFEAISRGASEATFIEISPRIAAVIRENARQFGVESSASVVAEDVARFLERYDGPSFDVVFADPPYTYAPVDGLPDLLLGLVAAGGLLILEHDGRYDFGSHDALVVQRAYGRTRVSLFTPRHQEDDA